jgi:hypothetical protein
MLAPEGHQRIQDAGGAGGYRPGAKTFQQSRLRGAAEIQDAVSDGHADHARWTAAKYSERQVLNGKIGAGPIGGFNPTRQLRIVRAVQKENGSK